MKIQLSDHFNYKRLIIFVMPSIFMMLFTSIYGVVDGLFVSNFVGKLPFASINFVLPVVMILGPLGFVIGTGGSAIVAKTMGEGDNKLANNYFSLMVYTAIITGAIIAVLGIFLIRPLCILLGASDSLIDDAVLYGRISMITMPFFMLQNVFQSFFITAERPKFGFICTFISGCLNMCLDAVLIGLLGWGVAGAAIATGVSEIVGGIIPIIFFISKKNTTPLRLGKARLDWRVLGKTCANGSSEFMNNISISVISMAYNWQLLKYAGESGVAAYGMIMYVNFIFIGVIFGYCLGTAPIISFEYGAQDIPELKNMFSKSMKLMMGAGLVIAAAAFISAPLLTRMFFASDPDQCELTIYAMRVFAISFVTSGVNIFISTLFTDLNNGIISAIISFCRTFIFRISALFILPIFFGTNGIWFAVLVAEVGALIVSLYYLISRRKKYNYY